MLGALPAPPLAALLAVSKGAHPAPKPSTPAVLQEILVNVAPKKANWDLRRDIADKLSKLERRTQVPASLQAVC